jgi:hypothetical protein
MRLPSSIIIGIDTRSALLIVAGIAVLILYTTQTYGLLSDLWRLTNRIHFHLVQAPLEAAMNSAKAALDERSGAQ